VEFTDGRLPQRLLTREVRHAISRTFSRSAHPTCSGTPHGQQEPINFGNQPVGAGYPNPGGENPEGGTPDPGAKGKGGRGGGSCICCCDGCDCCCDCGDCCDCT
jgi:hypothetical protein